MFDWLYDLISQFWESFTPVVIIRTYENAVHLRVGKYHRSIEQPGLYWKVPFFDEILSETVVPTTMAITPQSLVTKDGKSVVLKTIVKYEIHDIKTFLLSVYGANDAISDIIQGITKKVVEDRAFIDCMSMDEEITASAKKEIRKWGVRILNVTVTNFSEMRSIRLLMDSEYDS